FGHGFGGRGFRGGFGGSDAAAAAYLGITEATLRSDLQAGQSLAQIANATQGKTSDGLKAAIIAAETVRLNAAVSSGQITGAQEQQRPTDLSSRSAALLAPPCTAGTISGRASVLFVCYAAYERHTHEPATPTRRSATGWQP